MHTKIGQITYHEHSARVEIIMSKHLAKWLESQAEKAKTTPSYLIKTWLLKMYSQHAQKVSK